MYALDWAHFWLKMGATRDGRNRPNVFEWVATRHTTLYPSSNILHDVITRYIFRRKIRLGNMQTKNIYSVASVSLLLHFRIINIVWNNEHIYV